MGYPTTSRGSSEVGRRRVRSLVRCKVRQQGVRYNNSVYGIARMLNNYTCIVVAYELMLVEVVVKVEVNVILTY